jgi:hypothetical protein
MQDTRAVLDTLVQSSAVDLFHSFGIAVAPVALARQRAETDKLSQFVGHELLGSIAFVGKGFTGSLLLSVPDDVFQLLKQNPERPYTGRDWIREATNQMLGRIKNRLPQFQLSIQSGLPSTPGRDALERLRARSATFLVYGFRTLRGGACVALGGDIEPSLFVYSGAPLGAQSEGDIILF